MSAEEAGPGGGIPNVREGLLTVPEAAKALGISVSTAWRWIDRGILPSVRIGPKRVFVRREDLEPVTAAGRGRLRITPPPKLTKAERSRGLALLRELEKELAGQLAARGGAYFPPSEDVIDQMREERSRHLAESGGGRFKSFDHR